MVTPVKDASVVWMSLDLRLAGNPALARAIARGGPVIPAFVWAPEEEAPWSPGAASRWWLHQSLEQLAARLSKLGSRLIVRRGPTADALLDIARETGAHAVCWNRRYEPASLARECAIQQRLRRAGIEAESFPGNVLFEPGAILTGSGKPFQVFTAFWNALLKSLPPGKPGPEPGRPLPPRKWPASLPLSELHLEPEPDWAGGLRACWQPGEIGAHRLLREFLAQGPANYSAERDWPDHPGTSHLSPHLHFGEIGVRQIWHAAAGRDAWLRQIAWREFSRHLLFHFPRTGLEPLRPGFRRFPWRMDAPALKAWTRGGTGYPLVDAGMRELWHTGWMHNRMRMLAASFLVKHLLIPWQEGAAWFWDTLVDADLANNTMGWQWTAGCGADAAPFFRIFNPVVQGERFDPEGAYVRRWVPELSRLPAPWIHRPWQAPPLVLAESGVDLGRTYPRPIVDHHAARARALEALAETRGPA